MTSAATPNGSFKNTCEPIWQWSSAEVQPPAGAEQPRRPIDLAVFNTKTEFAVIVARTDELMRMGIHTRFDAQKHRRLPFLFNADGIEPLDFVQAVDNNCADTAFNGLAQLGITFIVAVKMQV